MQGHILKFVATGRTIETERGVRTYPQQTYGLSQDSPNHFKNRHSLTAKDGYIYKHEEAKGFAYLSQKKYMTLDHSPNPSPETQSATIDMQSHDRSLRFHRKKGLLSEFMDKNAWMAPVRPLMGYEREARHGVNLGSIANSIRVSDMFKTSGKEGRIHAEMNLLRNTIKSVSLMTEKSKIRDKRNALAEKQLPLKTLEVRQMWKTADQWHTARHSHVEEASPGVSLEDWYKTACTTKKWTYAPKKQDQQ